jgi:hypothetical protein
MSDYPKTWISDLAELFVAAGMKQSLMCEALDRPVAAESVLNMPGIKILHYIEAGLYVYTPKQTSVFPRRKEKA